MCGTQLHCALSRHNAHASERGSVQPGGHRQADASLAGWSGALNRTNGPSVLGHERLAKFVNEHLQPEGARAAHAVTKIVQGWPKSWANFEALIGIFSQSVGPSLAIWANPVQFSFVGRAVVHRRGGSSKIIMSIVSVPHSNMRGRPCPSNRSPRVLRAAYSPRVVPPSRKQACSCAAAAPALGFGRIVASYVV